MISETSCVHITAVSVTFTTAINSTSDVSHPCIAHTAPTDAVFGPRVHWLICIVFSAPSTTTTSQSIEQKQRILRPSNLLRLEQMGPLNDRHLLHRHNLHNLGRQHPNHTNSTHRPVFDLAFSWGTDVFTSVCADGSVSCRAWNTRQSRSTQFRFPAEIGMEQTKSQLSSDV
jgi:hypothetical protein